MCSGTELLSTVTDVGVRKLRVISALNYFVDTVVVWVGIGHFSTVLNAWQNQIKHWS